MWKSYIIPGAPHILFPRVTFTETWGENDCVVIANKEKKEKNAWPVGAQPFSRVFLDPIPPGGSDCPRQPGQQCDGHCSLGQCFCRTCEWIPWAWALTVLMPVSWISFMYYPPKSIEKNVVFLCQRQNRENMENGKSMGLKSGHSLSSGPRFPSFVTMGNSLYHWAYVSP